MRVGDLKVKFFRRPKCQEPDRIMKCDEARLRTESRNC